MKKAYKITAGLVAILVFLLAAFIFFQPNSKKEATSSVNSGSSKTSRSSNSSKTKSTQSSTSSSAADLSNNANDQNTNAIVTIPPSAEQVSSADVSNSQSVNSGDNQVEGGRGAAEVTSGTLELYQATPVYAEPNKNTSVVFTQVAGNLEWDSYISENGDFWYSFVVHSGSESTRYYIAYSDVGH